MSEKKLFQRLQGDVAALINATPAGERLPSEPELAKRLGVSRATLREAMRSFEAQGLIRRRQGLGTFVVSQAGVLDSGLEILESIDTLAARIKLTTTLGNLTINQRAADAVQAQALNVEPGAALLEVERVILAEERPVAYLVDVLPETVLHPSELAQGFTGSVLDYLIMRGQPVLAYSKTEIKAVAATHDVARSLQIQRGDVLLLFVAYLHSTMGQVIDYSFSYFLPGYFRFHVVRSIGPVDRTQS
jgi:GntR family transcriptional regulator